MCLPGTGTVARTLDRPMKYTELAILLPCQSLEDFPQHHEGEDAAGLLAGWTSLWHPALLAAAGAVPAWYRAADPPQQLAGKLLVAPSVSSKDLPCGFAARAQSEAACYIGDLSDRETILGRAIGGLDGGDGGVEASLASDFLALSYCYLQTQILTRQMRYSSSLDEAHFNSQLLAAAQAAVSGDAEAARDKLAACFGLLAEERDHYYAVDAFVLDLTLLTEDTLGADLRQELASPVPVNLLLSGRLLSIMAEREPATLAALKEALAAGRVGLVGGEEVELPLPLLSCESVLEELKRGLACYRGLLDRRVDVFGRRRFGMTPALPPILKKLGFQGACHATMEEGRFPQSSQVKTRWEGFGGASMDVLAKVPLDAGKAETFLSLGTKLGGSMDSDHVATLWLAHWPGRSCAWYEDLRRAACYGTAMGRFRTVEEYFRETYVPGHTDRFDIDQYRAPYLRQAVARSKPDPLSTHIRYWRRRTSLEAEEAWRTCLAAMGHMPPEAPGDAACEVDRGLEGGEGSGLDERLQRQRESQERALAASLPRQAAAARPGYLVLNPCSFVRRVGVELPELTGLPSVGRPIYAAAEDAHSKHAVVDVPPLGFVWVTAHGSPPPSRKTEPLLAEDRLEHEGYLVLRNEFFQAGVRPDTGSLSMLKDYSSRDNRMSQQIAYRIPGTRPELGDDQARPATYSQMVADEARIARASSVLGEIVTRGRLVDGWGKTLAGFCQTYRVWRGSRVLQLEVELEPAVEPGADPWDTYFACRFAWADEAAEVYRSVHQTRQRTKARRLEAPHYVEVVSGERRTAVLTGGLPYHRAVGDRKLDSLLIVPGERQRRFLLGIGVDLPHPIHEAIALLAPPAAIPQVAPPPSPNAAGWFFHLDAKGVLATHWSPLQREGAVVGFRTRLLETRGHSTKVRLRCFRPLRWARSVDFLGESLGDCRVEEGNVRVELAPYEWVEVEARWA